MSEQVWITDGFLRDHQNELMMLYVSDLLPMTDPNGAGILMLTSRGYMDLSENVVYPIVPIGFADHEIPFSNG